MSHSKSNTLIKYSMTNYWFPESLKFFIPHVPQDADAITGQNCSQKGKTSHLTLHRISFGACLHYTRSNVQYSSVEISTATSSFPRVVYLCKHNVLAELSIQIFDGSGICMRICDKSLSLVLFPLKGSPRVYHYNIRPLPHRSPTISRLRRYT